MLYTLLCQQQAADSSPNLGEQQRMYYLGSSPKLGEEDRREAVVEESEKAKRKNIKQ